MTTSQQGTHRDTGEGRGDVDGMSRGNLLYRIVVPPSVRRRRAQAAVAATRSSTGTGPRVEPATSAVPRSSQGRGSDLVIREAGSRAPRWLRWLGLDQLDEPSVLTSTRQAEALNPALVQTHPPLAGPPAGIDVMTNNAWGADAHLLYEQDRITSPHRVTLGGIGSGKTSLTMTNDVVRQVAMGKQVAVFDRKRQQAADGTSRGEYYDAARVCVGEVVRFSRIDGRSINLLDPRLATTGDSESGVVGQDDLLRLAAEYAHGPLSSKETAALAAAHRQAIVAGRAAGRYANIRDVIDALFDPLDAAIPHESLRRRQLVDTDEMVRWGLDLALDLQRFAEGDLSGLIDADTSADINWDAPLLVFDTSELQENSPALSLVMMLVTSFLSSVWSSKPAQRVIVLEEGYHASSLDGAGTVTVVGILKSLLKRGRGIGLSFGIVIHHLSDIPKSSDAISLVKEAGIVHIYRQDKTDDIRAALEEFGLPAQFGELLRDLEQGCHIMMIGSEPPRLVRHVRSTLERQITDSDAAMLGRLKLGAEETTLTGPGADEGDAA